METRTVKLPKALINISRLMMPMFVDVRGLFVSCQDLRDTKGVQLTDLEARDQTVCVREVSRCPKNLKNFRNVFTCISNMFFFFF